MLSLRNKTPVYPVSSPSPGKAADSQTRAFLTKNMITMMNIQVEAPFQVKEDLQRLIEEKVTKLNKFFERITTAQVYLKNEENRRQHANDFGKSVEIRMEIPNHSLHATALADSFEEALADAAEKMRRQLRKHKELMNGR